MAAVGGQSPFRAAADNYFCKAISCVPLIGDVVAMVADIFLDRQLDQLRHQTGLNALPAIRNAVKVIEVKQHYKSACIANKLIGLALLIAGLAFGIFVAPNATIILFVIFIGMGAWNIYDYRANRLAIQSLERIIGMTDLAGNLLQQIIDNLRRHHLLERLQRALAHSETSSMGG